MACPSNERLISFVYDEMSRIERDEIRHHMETCALCQEEIAAMRAIEDTLTQTVPQQIRQESEGDHCPDLMMLTRYVSGSLASTERTTVEAHLARCGSCLDELVAAEEYLAADSGKHRRTPVHLLDQALQLGAQTSARKIFPGIFAAIRQWFESMTPQPSWALAGACAVVLLTVVIARQIHQGEAEKGNPIQQVEQQTTDPNRPKAELVFETRLDLTEELKAALIDYDPKGNPESQKKLLSLIQQKAPELTLDRINQVEIEDNLLIAIASNKDLGGEAHVRLYKHGLLVIGANAK